MTSTPPAVDPNVAELRVASRTPTPELAAAISHAIYDGKRVVLRAIGAGAVNQAVKGLVVAQSYVAQRGMVLANRPGFLTIDMDGEERTAMTFTVFTL
jgi:stage V sporulation protein S